MRTTPPRPLNASLRGQDADFIFAQRVWDDIRTMRDFLRHNELVVAIHPDDLSDGVRREIEAAPLVTLRESTLIQRGTIFTIRTGLLMELSGGDPS